MVYKFNIGIYILLLLVSLVKKKLGFKIIYYFIDTIR